MSKVIKYVRMRRSTPPKRSLLSDRRRAVGIRGRWPKSIGTIGTEKDVSNIGSRNQLINVFYSDRVAPSLATRSQYSSAHTPMPALFMKRLFGLLKLRRGNSVFVYTSGFGETLNATIAIHHRPRDAQPSVEYIRIKNKRILNDLNTLIQNRMTG